MTGEEYDTVKRSRENLAYMYQSQLRRMINGHSCSIIPRKIRLRMQEYGILKKFGNTNFVTVLGKKGDLVSCSVNEDDVNDYSDTDKTKYYQ